METLFFLFDALVMTMLVFFSLRNDKRNPRDGTVGMFSYKEKDSVELIKLGSIDSKIKISNPSRRKHH